MCRWSGAVPHIGLGVNSSQTIGRRTREGTSGFMPLVPVGWPVPGEVSPDHMDDVAECTNVATTPEQDERIEECIKRNMRSVQMYNLYSNSCVDFVRQCMSEGLGGSYSDTNFPGTLYDEIK